MTGRRVVIGLAGVATLALSALVLGGGWVYAGQLLPAPSRDRTLDTTATVTSSGTVVLPADRRACLERFGLLLQDGFLQYGGPVEGSCDGAGTVERQVLELTPEDVIRDVPQPARFDEYVYSGGPEEVGVEVQEVLVPTGRGDAEAWFVPGERPDWVVFVHGRSGTRAEALRLLPTVTELGFPSLVITYRNDFAGGPDAADDVGRFGQEEWRDLAAAVEYARQEGARRVVLVGFSQGGSLVSYYLREVGEDDVAGVILDAPLLSLPDTLVQQARLRDIPDPLIPPILLGTRLVARVRSGLDIGDVDHVETLAQLQAPTLLIHGAEDDFVPVGPSDEVAERRQDGLVYERVEGAGHVEAYNADPERYTAVVAEFLRGL